MKPFSNTAIQAHCLRAAEEGGERVVKTWNHFPGYLVEIVWFAGEECLRLTPVGASYADCSVLIWQAHDEALIAPGEGKGTQVCIPRSLMAAFLNPDGSPEYEAFRCAAIWLGFMGKEISHQSIATVVNVLVETWSDFYAVLPDVLQITAPPLAHVTIRDQDGRIQDERVI